MSYDQDLNEHINPYYARTQLGIEDIKDCYKMMEWFKELSDDEQLQQLADLYHYSAAGRYVEIPFSQLWSSVIDNQRYKATKPNNS